MSVCVCTWLENRPKNLLDFVKLRTKCGLQLSIGDDEREKKDDAKKNKRKKREADKRFDIAR